MNLLCEIGNGVLSITAALTGIVFWFAFFPVGYSDAQSRTSGYPLHRYFYVCPNNGPGLCLAERSA